MGRRGAIVFALTLVSGLIWTIAPVRGNVADLEASFAEQVNAERSAAGLPGYEGAADLVEVARRHSARMASEQRLYHNPALSSEVQDWQAVGENVGVGSSVDSIHQAFMASQTHREVILSSTFTQVGMGVYVDDDGGIWVTQVFRKPQSAAPAPQPAAAAPATEPPPAEPRAARAPRAPVATPAPAPVAPAVEGLAPGGPASAADEAAAAAAAAAASAAVSEAEEARVAAVAAFEAAATLAAPPAPVTAPADVAPGVAARDRRVTLPIGFAASFLLAVVLGLLAEVGRYPLSDWRRQRNQDSMSSSRSPSSTAWTFPVS